MKDPIDLQQQQDAENDSLLSQSAFDTGTGSASLPPPPLNLGSTTAVQRQKSGEELIEGFTPVSLLGVARSAPKKETEEKPVFEGGANLRLEPATDDETNIIRRIPYQEQFFIKAESTNWYKVRTMKGEDGYVFKQNVSINDPDTIGFTVHVIQAGETAMGLAHKYFNSEDAQAEWKPNELDYAKAIWAYNKQHYGEEIGIIKSSEQKYALPKAGIAIWIPSTDWAYRYIQKLPRKQRHGDSLLRLGGEFLLSTNPFVTAAKPHLEKLAEGFDAEAAQAVISQLKEKIEAGRESMIGAIQKVPALKKVIPGGNAGVTIANFATSFLVGALDQAAKAPPETLIQVLKSYLLAIPDGQFNIGLFKGTAAGIGKWFSDIWDTITALGGFIKQATVAAFSKDTYTKEIPELARALEAAMPDIVQFIQEIKVSEIMAFIQDKASAMGKQLGASSFGQLLQHLGNSPFGQGFASGKLIGYLIPEIALAVGTSGAGAAVKGAATALKGLKTALGKVAKVGVSALKAAKGLIVKLMQFAGGLLNSASTKGKAFGAKLMKLLQKLLTIVKGVKGRGVWDLPPFQRGRQLERLFDDIFPINNYPVIDYFRRKEGIASSIKSVDLLAPTYKDPSKLKSLLKGYTNKVSNFKGRGQFGGVPPIRPRDIKVRRLDLVIPDGAPAAQMKVVNDMIAYGNSLPNKVEVVIKIVSQ